MKHILLASLAFCLFACTKSGAEAPSSEAIVENEATIQWWRYSCGTSCDAAAWVLVLEDGSAYETTELPKPFQTDNTEVIVKLKRTGIKSPQYQGTGLEQAQILNIRPK